MTRVSRIVSLALVTVLALAVPPMRHRAAAQTLSFGCTVMNIPFFDGYYGAKVVMAPFEFNAHEVITVKAGPPAEEPPTSFELRFDGAAVASAPYPGTLVYTIPADVSGISEVWVGAVGGGATFAVSCTYAAPPGPGCDVQMPISDTSVVGTFVKTTPTYWTPGQPTSPLVTIPAGKTAWVLGTDPSGRYYEIVWVCNLLWVPVDTMGPNYDDVWKGRPLPGGATGSSGTSGSPAGPISAAASGGGYFPVNSAPVTASTYIVQRGDNLFRIALHFGVDLNRLAAVNGISDPRRIFVGQVLNIAAAR
jgi:hypothetical protein